ncbi:right-handed parallel beta-helix repeat-containing protein [Achromobacter sp. UBA4530]|uniref:right-handed parallel beta-helix repeat-containing protein n=1 Tax=Achromobacter sp. UBA4530 TaxID=1945912 RepID=UPI00257CAD3B|nr:right-handed parallel beta-helix repeat-containing protein [Achromobacter sp. UBA4530]
MTTYRTGNPLGSVSVKDLYDNAENFDTAMNDRAAEYWEDRLGHLRLSWHGAEEAIQRFLLNSGYQDLGEYAVGMLILSRNQIFRKDGELWRAAAALELPYTTSGEWEDEGSSFVSVGDAALRQELAAASASGSGAGLVGFVQDGVGATARTTLAKLRDTVSVRDFGAVGDGVVDDTAAVQRALDAGHPVVLFPKGTYRWGGNGPTVRSGTKVIGHGAVIVQPNYDAAATISVGNENCGLRVDVGSDGIEISGIEFRGPFYGAAVLPVYRSIGVSISGRYDQYFYNNPNWPNNPAVTPSSTSSNIKVRDCVFDGWGQSGVLADQIDQLQVIGCKMLNCGRDGLRMYGVRNFLASQNYIDNMAPGFPAEGVDPNNNVYGITATRIYRSAALDGSIDVYRTTAYGQIALNVVRNCRTWKALDTHGGTDILFVDNVIRNAHIGIGIDKGGFTATQGFAPPRRIKCRGNIIIADASNAAGNRSGIFAVANDATDTNIGQDLELSGNYITGFGEDTRDGNLVVSNYRHVVLDGNTIIGGLRSGINLQGTVEDISITGGMIADIAVSTLGNCVAIQAQAAPQRGVIDGVMFRKTDAADSMTAISMASATAGYGFKVGASLLFFGNVVHFNAGGVFVRQDSQFVLKPLAWGNVNNGGSAALVSGKGIASVTKTGTGVVRVVLTAAASSTSTFIPMAVSKGSSGRLVSCAIVDESTVDVTSRDQTGAPVDSAFFFSVQGF